jgi:alkyldihydroxyacetonephosphate synthase
MWDIIRTELEDVVGVENVDVGLADLITNGSDGFWLSSQLTARGQVPTMPDIVVHPGSVSEVSKIMVIANYYKIPVIPVGGASGAQGGITPVKGGISVDMKRMNKVLEIDEISRTVTTETGINFQQLEWYANERGYSLMHYPSSITCSTVGGFLAHNGIGVLSTKYGKIDDQCIWVEVVIPNGSILESSPVPKHSSGPYLKDVFIGSEGTLGIITKAKFKLFKIPEVRIFRAFLFKNLTDAIAAGRDMLAEFKPSILRLYDEAETKSIIRNILGVEKPGVFMNMAFDGMEKIVKIELERTLEICTGNYGAVDLGEDYGKKWWDHRVTFFYPGHMFKYPQMYGTMDSCGTYQNIEKIYWAMKKAIETNFPMARFIAHFSHWYEWGCMIYDRFIIDQAPEDPMEAMRLHNQIWRTGVRAALANGGVINDHHGVGLKLGSLMKEQYGSSMMIYDGLKKLFDPNGIMNPFKMGI